MHALRKLATVGVVVACLGMVQGAAGGSAAAAATSCTPATVTAASPESTTVPAGTAVTFGIMITEVGGGSGCDVIGAPLGGSTLAISDNGSLVATLTTNNASWTPNFTAHTLKVSWTSQFTGQTAHAVLFSYSNTNGTPTGSSTTSHVYVPPTIPSLTSSANPSSVGHDVTFTASVDWNDCPATTSVVTFWDGTVNLGHAVISSGSEPSAAFTTSALLPGTHVITATIPNAIGSTELVRSRVIDELVKVVATPTPTPDPTPPPTARPTAPPTSAPTPAPTPHPTAAPTPSPTAVATITPTSGTITPPPGAAPNSLVAGAHLTGAQVPLVGAHPPQAMSASIWDTSAVPPFQPLTAIGIDFGNGLSITPALLVITLLASIGILRARRHWMEEDAELQRQTVINVGGPILPAGI